MKSWSRREVLTLGAGVFAVAALPVSSIVRARWTEGLVRRAVPVMGTIGEIVVVSHDAAAARKSIDRAVERLHLVDRTMTRFDPSSEIGRANTLSASRPVRIGRMTATVIAEALRWAGSTGGLFDPCLGRAVEVWDVTRRNAPPAQSDWAHLAGRRLYEALTLEGDRIAFADRDVAIDLGGIAKGFAADFAADALTEDGFDHTLVNVGGDLVARGLSRDGDPWLIGVRSASDPSRIARKISIRDEAVATSGDYERYFDFGGRRYHHLIDPATASPRVVEEHSLTVVAKSCMSADAAATALFGRTSREVPKEIRVLDPSIRLA